MKTCYVIGVALVAGMVGAQSEKIIDAARFVVFNGEGKPAVTMSHDQVGSGDFAVFGADGREMFSVHGISVSGVAFDKAVSAMIERQVDAVRSELERCRQANTTAIDTVNGRLDKAEAFDATCREDMDLHWQYISSLLTDPETIRLRYATFLIEKAAAQQNREMTDYEKAVLAEMKAAREQTARLEADRYNEQVARDARESNERQRESFQEFIRSQQHPR